MSPSVTIPIAPVSPPNSRCTSPTNEFEESWIDPLFVSKTSLEEYSVVKTIGQGTFGKVRLCQHQFSREYVAIKYIEKSKIKHQKQKQSIRREVRLLMLLRHPNIINILDVIETRDRICIIMEHLPKGELFEHIVKNHHLNETEARVFMQQIVSAVDYCHDHSIMHRDLKPENLLLDESMNLKLIDFGLGNTFDGQNFSNTFCGSPFYASPQMIRGVKYTGPESDIWSLGVILFAMLSGRLPFDAEDQPKLYDRIASGIFRCPAFLSKPAVDLIQKMLVVSPTSRYTIEQVKSHPWMMLNSSPGLYQFPFKYPLFHSLISQNAITILKMWGFDVSNVYQVLTTNLARQKHPIVGYYRLLVNIMETCPNLIHMAPCSMVDDSTTTLNLMDSHYSSLDAKDDYNTSLLNISQCISSRSSGPPTPVISTLISSLFNCHPTPANSPIKEKETADSALHSPKIQLPHSIVKPPSQRQQQVVSVTNIKQLPELSLTSAVSMLIPHKMLLVTQHPLYLLQNVTNHQLFVNNISCTWLNSCLIQCEIGAFRWNIDFVQISNQHVIFESQDRQQQSQSPSNSLMSDITANTLQPKCWCAKMVNVIGTNATPFVTFILGCIKTNLDEY